MWKSVHLFLLTISVAVCLSAHSEEVVNRATSQADVAHGSCSVEQREERQAILKMCDAKWKEWGVDPVPPKNELLDPNNCPGTLKSAANIAGGCATSLISVPAMLGQLYIMGLIAVAPTDKTSFAYVSQHGSLQDMKAFYTNEWVRKKCRFADAMEESAYRSLKCSKPGEKVDCNPVIEEIRASTECRRDPAFRQEGRSKLPEFQAKAEKLFKEQQERKTLARKHNDDLTNIRNKCASILNKYSESYSAMLMNPVGYLYSEASNKIQTDPKDLKKYNQCVIDNSKGNKELQEKLLKSTSGWVEDAAEGIESMQCYREDIQAKLKCDVALMATGAGGATAAVLKKLGKKAISMATRASVKTTEKLTAQLDKVLENSSTILKPQASGKKLEVNMEGPNGRLAKFIVYPNKHAGAWAREHGLVKEFAKDSVGKVKLDPGDYNYVIRKDGTLVVGKIDDVSEYGVRHLNLANENPIIGGGQLRMKPNGQYELNIGTGTYGPELVAEAGSNIRLEENMRTALESYFGQPGKVKSFTTRLRPDENPTTEKFIELCNAVSIFRESNRGSCCKLSRTLCN